jgi:hypothetical protein
VLGAQNSITLPLAHVELITFGTDVVDIQGTQLAGPQRAQAINTDVFPALRHQKALWDNAAMEIFFARLKIEIMRRTEAHGGVRGNT